ncbi:MAG: adenosylcobinamide-GDP ribazoletransferase [Candidatus Omnitrophota bacterium]|nr:adenosylcobinamide-GDP ribazoletransferase [Candidatus Omnitrophota bacterium]
MTSFLLALQFLTIIPIKIKRFDKSKFINSMIYFPVVGLLLALFLAAINNLFLFLGFNSIVTNVILVIALIVITGGMHLDGLSDTFDALVSSKDKERMLEIMRDPHCGVMGILSVICVILLKISFLSSLNPAHKINALILMCVLSRAALVFLIFMFPYTRKEGKGKIFSEEVNLKIINIVGIITLICAGASFKIKGLLTMAVATLVAFIFAKFITKKVGGITGDSLGAANELTEVTVLVTLCFLEKGGVI